MYVNHERSQGLKDFKALNPAIESQAQRKPKEGSADASTKKDQFLGPRGQESGRVTPHRLIVPGTTGLKDKWLASFSIFTLGCLLPFLNHFSRLSPTAFVLCTRTKLA